jgi:hypothetical protein
VSFIKLFTHLVGLRSRVQPTARPLHTQGSTTQQDVDKHPCLEEDRNKRSQSQHDQGRAASLIDGERFRSEKFIENIWT